MFWVYVVADRRHVTVHWQYCPHCFRGRHGQRPERWIGRFETKHLAYDVVRIIGKKQPRACKSCKSRFHDLPERRSPTPNAATSWKSATTVTPPDPRSSPVNCPSPTGTIRSGIPRWPIASSTVSSTMRTASNWRGLRCENPKTAASQLERSPIRMRDNLQSTPGPRRLGRRPRRGRHRPLCERRMGIRLWKVPPPWKPAAKPARSHSGLEAFGSHTSHGLDGGITYKPLTRGWVPFTRSGGPFYVVQAIYIQGGIVRCKLHLKRCSCWTEAIHFGNDNSPQRRFAPTGGCFPRNRGGFHVGITGDFCRNTQIDTNTTAGRLLFGIFAPLAEFERELIINGSREETPHETVIFSTLRL